MVSAPSVLRIPNMLYLCSNKNILVNATSYDLLIQEMA